MGRLPRSRCEEDEAEFVRRDVPESLHQPFGTVGWVPQSASPASPLCVIWTRPEPSALTIAMSDRFPFPVVRVKTIFFPSGDHPGYEQPVDVGSETGPPQTGEIGS